MNPDADGGVISLMFNSEGKVSEQQETKICRAEKTSRRVNSGFDEMCHSSRPQQAAVHYRRRGSCFAPTLPTPRPVYAYISSVNLLLSVAVPQTFDYPCMCDPSAKLVSMTRRTDDQANNTHSHQHVCVIV